MFNKPILFIIFNRPDTTLKVFEIIKKIKPTRLYVAADGPRLKDGEAESCALTRNIISGVDWECEVKTRFLDNNLGCHTAVPAAISWFFENEESGIILEDDCLADLSFFSFCSNLLDKYRDEEDIMMISGDNFISSEIKSDNNGSYYFSKYTNIWGWGSWRRAWKKYISDFKSMDDGLMRSEVRKSFSGFREKKYWYGFYKKIKSGRLWNWDAKWSLSIIYSGGKNIIPRVNLVKNIGFGPEATHSAGGYHLSINTSFIDVINPDNNFVNHDLDKKLFLKIYYRNIFNRVFYFFKILFKKIKF